MEKSTKLLRQSIKDEIARYLVFFETPHMHDVTLELLFDIVAPQLVYNYYTTNGQYTFEEYISHANIKKALENPVLKEGIAKFRDLMSIKEKFWRGIVTDDFVYLGDLHDVVTKIKSGNSVYYENFLDNENYFQQIITEIAPAFKNLLPRFETTSQYIKRQYVKFDDSNFVPEEYFENFGLLLAFAFFFRLTDLHMENVVVSDNWTKIFDFEFAFSPDYDHLDFGIMPTNLVSYKTEDNISALLGGYFPINSYMKPVMRVDDSGKPEIIWKVPSKRVLYNIPSEDKRNKLHPKLYVGNIMAGFKKGHQELTNKREAIVKLTKSSSFRVRQLVRPTRQYRYLMVSYAYPQNHTRFSLKEHYEHAFRHEPWKDFFNPVGDVLKPLELADCASLKIPYYYSDIRNNEVYHSSGKVIGHLKETPVESFIRHIEPRNYEKFVKRHIANTKRILTINYKEYTNGVV